MTKMFNFKEKSEINVTICHTAPHCNLWLFTVPLESKVRERKKDTIKRTKETKKVTFDSNETVNNHRLQPVIVYSSTGIKSKRKKERCDQMNERNEKSYFWFIFFSIWVFFYEHSRITGLQGKGEGISLTPHSTSIRFTDTWTLAGRLLQRARLWLFTVPMESKVTFFVSFVRLIASFL